MIVGIPKAFLYYRHHVLWETFLDELSIEHIDSGDTDRRMLAAGSLCAIDESCLSSKIYLGHVDALLDRCDAILVPRIANLAHRDILCTKFMALYDIAYNTFRDRNVTLLDYEIDASHGKRELAAFMQLGCVLGAKRPQALQAYLYAKQAEQIADADAVRRQEVLLEKDGVKVLIVGHGYNVHDALVGRPVQQYLSAQGVTPILADTVDRKRALEAAVQLTQTLPWIYNRELVGAVQLYRPHVDGIILLSAFPCGPDALVNEVLLRKIKDIPMLTLLMDGQEGTAGIETRLESFLDILQDRREVHSEQA